MRTLTIEEKLQHFTMVTIESVHEECEKSLEEFKREQDWKFETHKEQHLKEVRIREKTLRDAIERKASKEYTYEQLHIKRKINHKQNELKARLFELVEKRLNDFKETNEYKELIIKEIKEAQNIAKDSELKVYIGSNDENMLEAIYKECGISPALSDNIVKGGMRAEIPSKNILIDNTFETKIGEAWEKFIITL